MGCTNSQERQQNTQLMLEVERLRVERHERDMAIYEKEETLKREQETVAAREANLEQARRDGEAKEATLQKEREELAKVQKAYAQLERRAGLVAETPLPDNFQISYPRTTVLASITKVKSSGFQPLRFPTAQVTAGTRCWLEWSYEAGYSYSGVVIGFANVNATQHTDPRCEYANVPSCYMLVKDTAVVSTSGSSGAASNTRGSGKVSGDSVEVDVLSIKSGGKVIAAMTNKAEDAKLFKNDTTRLRRFTKAGPRRFALLMTRTNTTAALLTAYATDDDVSSSTYSEMKQLGEAITLGAEDDAMVYCPALTIYTEDDCVVIHKIAFDEDIPLH